MSDALLPQTIKPVGQEAPNAQAVQGVTGGVPIPVQGVAGATSDVTLHDNAVTTQHLGIDAAGKAAVAPAVATAAAPTYGEGAIVSLSTDLAGALRIGAGAGLTDTQLRASAVPVSLASVPLPTGASTEATLALIKAKTDNLDVLLSTRTKPADTQTVSGTVALSAGAATIGKVDQGTGGLSAWKVDGSAVIQPVSAASLPLPTNAAQETGGNLATIAGKDFATQTTLALIKTDVDKIPSQGAAVTAASTPVNIASDQVVSVSATALPLPTGAATAARQDTGNTSLASIDTKLVTYADGAVEGTGTGMLGMALSGDAPPVRLDGNIYPLSITNDGRLRVSMVPARAETAFFALAELKMWDANDDRYWGGYSPNWTHTGNPFTDW